MKNELIEAREIINKIDEEMILLFKKRMEAVKMVVNYKIENNLEVLDASREKSQIENNVKILNDEELKEFYIEFFNGVLSSSKNFQKKIINK